MDPVNLAFEVPSGRWAGIVWVVQELYEHPLIGIPVGILLISVLIIVVVRVVQMRRGDL
jgi:hypothetical protein